MYNYYDLAQQSLAKVPSSITETYYPLWVYSSGYSQFSNTGGYTANILLAKGSTSQYASTSANTKLHTLNPNWSASQKFAFEASFYSGGSGVTAYFALFDITSGSAVSASQVSTAATTATLLRSGQFTLTPGHVYGVAGYVVGSSYNGIINKASLIAFLS